MDVVTGVAGLLLTGGSSRRMGRDKATIVVAGEELAARAAAVLRAALAGPLMEVGPGRSGLPALAEDPPGGGPLAAIAAASSVLDCSHPAFVLAVDMPAVTPELVRLLAGHPATRSVLPADEEGRLQPLCARWSPAALAAAPALLAAGERSLRALIDAAPIMVVPPDEWRAVAGPHALLDADTPADLERLETLL